MYISKINLRNFRNYEDIKIELSPDVNIIYGLNAEGKTNIAESISFLSNFKSFRTSKIKELVKIGNDGFFVKALYNYLDRDYKINVEFKEPRYYKVDINGVKYKTKSEILGKIRVIVFCPDDLLLIKESSEIRRKFLNDTIIQFRPKYHKLLVGYNKILKQKNMLLKQEEIDENGILNDYNELLAKLGAEISYIRANFLSELKKEAIELYSEISSNKEVLDFKYETKLSSCAQGVDKNYEEYKELFKIYKSREIKARNSLIGVHKDDISFFIDEKNARSYASQGQTRSIVLSLKFGLREMFLKDIKTLPILVLDDVLSELDEKRQDFVLNKIDKGQIIITSPYKDSINIKAKMIDLKEIKSKE